MTRLLARSVACSLVAALAGSCGSSAKLVQAPHDPLERIPTDWVDLPEAPFVSQILQGKAVLVNRTRESFSTVTAGCVVEENGTVQVVGGLFTVEIYDSAWGPGRAVEGLLRDVNNIDYYVANQERVTGRKDVIKPCPPGANTAVTSASLRDGHKWIADGTKWGR